MIEINTETQYVPNAAGMVKIFAPGMAQQIIVHIFRHKFVEERVDVGDEEDGGHIVNKKVKNLDDNASNNNRSNLRCVSRKKNRQKGARKTNSKR